MPLLLLVLLLEVIHLDQRGKVFRHAAEVALLGNAAHLQLYDSWDLFQSYLSECGCAVAAWRLFPAAEWDTCSGSAIPMTSQREMH